MSVGVFSATNLQTVWLVFGVEAHGARHGGQAVGPNGGRSARMSKMGRRNMRNVIMRVKITEAIPSEWSN